MLPQFLQYLLFWSHYAIAATLIPIGQSFVSPDKRFSVELAGEEGALFFRIKDEKTGATDSSVVMPTALLFLRWTANSRSVVAVNHIAGGSFVQLLYFGDKRRESMQFIPKGRGRMEFQVAAIIEYRDFLHIRYLVTREHGNRTPIDYQIYEFNFQLNTGAERDEKWTSLTEEAFCAEAGKPFLYLEKQSGK